MAILASQNKPTHRQVSASAIAAIAVVALFCGGCNSEQLQLLESRKVELARDVATEQGRLDAIQAALVTARGQGDAERTAHLEALATVTAKAKQDSQGALSQLQLVIDSIDKPEDTIKHGSELIGGFLPPPFNMIIPSVGALLAGVIGGNRRGKRRGASHVAEILEGAGAVSFSGRQHADKTSVRMGDFFNDAIRDGQNRARRKRSAANETIAFNPMTGSSTVSPAKAPSIGPDDA